MNVMCRKVSPLFVLILLLAATVARATPVSDFTDSLNNQLFDYYQSPKDHEADAAVLPTDLAAKWSGTSREILTPSEDKSPLPLAAGRLKARLQQALTYEMSLAVRSGRIEDAKALRAELNLPRGVSATEGSLLLQAITSSNRDQTSRLLVREAITWQTTRVRVLFDEATRDAARVDMPLPGRLLERLGEALTLATLPDPLKLEAGLDNSVVAPSTEAAAALLDTIRTSPWTEVAQPLAELRRHVESRLPSLLSDKERLRRERMLLKLVQLIPSEYSAGVRNGAVVVPLEYREAVSFTQDTRQIVGELAPLWLSAGNPDMPGRIDRLEKTLARAAQQIDAKADKSDITETFTAAADILKNEFDISLRRAGTTADIVDEVMLETRSLLSKSLAAAIAGNWEEAKRLRVEAYTTYDPDLEARLMPRDPQLAIDIERLLLDGIDSPGIKVLLDKHASDQELEAGYTRVNEALAKAAALLKSDIAPQAAMYQAASIVLREGLEGLLVVIAIFAGLRGAENGSRRRLFWAGIVLSLVATGGTWVLSQTVLTSLRAYGEIIAAVTGLLAIGVLLLITNWLFHQVYWRQWVTTLKAQAQGESPWQLISVGFLVGYREGFETILFLQSLYLDVGGRSVSLGVAIGVVLLLILGIAALKIGLKLPYFQILLATAVLIGFVLITFVGGTVRAMQTVGWLNVDRLTPGSWPTWMGTWLGLHNTRQSILAQVFICIIVLGTWRVARWKAKRKYTRRVPLAQVVPAPDRPAFVCQDRPANPADALSPQRSLTPAN